MGRQLTKDELIASLRHSKLQTILVEGITDRKIYRWIEEDINENSDFNVDILSCGCRSVLFDVYKYCSELPNVIFIADKDTYVYTNKIPSEYSKVIFTTGYSIENDLFQGGAFVKQWFKKEDNTVFAKCLEEYIKYYAIIFEEWKKNGEISFEIKSPSQVLDDKTHDLKDVFFTHSPSQEIINYLTQSYDLLIQGHALSNIILKVLSRKTRSSKPNLDAVYEACYKSYESDCIKLLKNKVIDRLRIGI